MILRLFRATVRPAAEIEVLRRLRDETLPEIRTLPGLHAFASGFRREGGRTEHLALSTWSDLAAIETQAGTLEGSVVAVPSDDIFASTGVDHYELVEPEDDAIVTLDGPVIGVVRAHVAPNADASAIEAIRRSRIEIAAAGVLAVHVGRRVHGHQTELAVLAVWRDRASLRRFAARRDGSLIRPAFLAQLTEWSFETWDCVSPERRLIPPAGPAVLVTDDTGRYVDASPGVEAVLDIPGELLLGRTVEELTAPAGRDGFEAAWAAFLASGHQTGAWSLCLPDGRDVAVRFRAATNVPEPGLHASVLSLPHEPPDPRRIEDVVAEAFAEAAGGVDSALVEVPR